MSSKDKSCTDNKLSDNEVNITYNHDGSQVDIDVNETRLEVTNPSFNITIGNLNISLKPKVQTDNGSKDKPKVPTDNGSKERRRDDPIFDNPVAHAAIVSSFTNKPLHIETGKKSNSVTANISFSKLIV